MNISPTSNISSQAQSFLNNDTVRATKKELDSNDFLKLLATQMTTQDPMKPMEDTQFMSQMASFTSLEQMKTLTQNMSAFTSQQSIATASEYLGKTVTVTPANSTSVSGTVSGVSISGGKPQIMINNVNYNLADITAVKVASATPTTPAAPAAPATPAISTAPTTPGTVGTAPTIPTTGS